MFLQDFIIERGVKQSTVSMYIKRHAADFENHTSMKDGKLWLDETAQELLGKKYPVLPVDDVWTPAAKKAYDELAEELRETNREVRKLNEENRELRQFEIKYRALETEQRLLVEEAVLEKDKEISILEGYLRESKENYKILEEEKNSWIATFTSQEQEIYEKDELIKKEREQHISEVNELQKKLQIEQNKSWWDKLRKR